MTAGSTALAAAALTGLTANAQEIEAVDLFDAGGCARTMDFHPSDVGYIEQSKPHYLENIGNNREENERQCR